jgi:hypothetical protein
VHFWFKKASDLELPGCIDRTLKDATAFLVDENVFGKHKRRQPTPWGLLIIAFGTKAYHFDWTLKTGTSQPDRVVESKPEPSPSASVKLTSLTDDRPLDISVKAERDRFEAICFNFIQRLKDARAKGKDGEQK